MASYQKLNSGKWRALIRKTGSPAQSGTFSTKTQAKKWAEEVERQIDSVRKTGGIDVAKGLLFSDFIDAYIEATDAVKAHGRTKKTTLLLLKKGFKNVEMSDLSEHMMKLYVSKRIKDRNQAGEQIKGSTIAIDLSYITTVLKWAKDVKGYNIDTNIALAARSAISASGLSTKSNERDREASDEEIKMIMDEYKAKRRQEIPMSIIINFALATAMRQEEICNMKIDDIDFDKRTVIIRDRKDPKEKIGNDQIVPLLPAAWSIVQDQIKGRKSGRVFPFVPDSVSTSFTRVCKKLEINDLHFHDLRHTAIGNLFAIGLQIQEVALLSGHKDWKMLKRYTHIKAVNVHKAFSRLTVPMEKAS